MAAVRVRDFLFGRKKKQKRKGAVFRVRPLHPENSATPSGVVCCSGVLPPPVSGGNREREGGVRAQGEVLLMKVRASSECASVLKKGGECALTGGSPLDGEWCVVGGCVGAEKGGEVRGQSGGYFESGGAPSGRGVWVGAVSGILVKGGEGARGGFYLLCGGVWYNGGAVKEPRRYG